MGSNRRFRRDAHAGQVDPVMTRETKTPRRRPRRSNKPCCGLSWLSPRASNCTQLSLARRNPDTIEASMSKAEKSVGPPARAMTFSSRLAAERL